MKELAELLSQNPVIILIMFLITVLGTIIGIVLGWKQFYTDYLSKSIRIPVWMFLIGSFSLIILMIFLTKNESVEQPKELTLIEGKQFGVQQVVLDGKRFERCSFNGTEMIFKGTNGFSLSQYI